MCQTEMAGTIKILSTATGGAGSAGLAWGPEPSGLTDVHSVPGTSRQGSRDHVLTHQQDRRKERDCEDRGLPEGDGWKGQLCRFGWIGECEGLSHL